MIAGVLVVQLLGGGEGIGRGRPPPVLDGQVEWGCKAIRRVVTGVDDDIPYVRKKTASPVPVTLLLIRTTSVKMKRFRLTAPHSCSIAGVRFVSSPELEPESLYGLAVRVEAREEGGAEFDIVRLWLPINPKAQTNSPSSIERDRVLGLDTSL